MILLPRLAVVSFVYELGRLQMALDAAEDVGLTEWAAIPPIVHEIDFTVAAKWFKAA